MTPVKISRNTKEFPMLGNDKKCNILISYLLTCKHKGLTERMSALGLDGMNQGRQKSVQNNQGT